MVDVATVDRLLAKHSVQTASVCVMHGGGRFDHHARGGRDQYDENSVHQIASLSKTVGTALALECFAERGISLSTPVNDVLAAHTSATWRARVNPSVAGQRGTEGWERALVLEHLMSHSGGLGLHYVNGIPGGEGKRMPPPEELIAGKHEKEFG